MTVVERIEREIAQLSRDELIVLRDWFLRHDAEEWDRRIEEDAIAGKLDVLAEEALESHRAGKTEAM